MIRSCLCASLLASLAPAQDLWVARDSDDTIARVSAMDGSILDPMFIDLSLSGIVGIPIEAVAVGGEIWVSDQTADTLLRFSGDGTTYLGSTGALRDNMRGLASANGRVYVSNSGTSGGAPGDVVKEYDTSGVVQNTWPVGDPFDVAEYGGQLLVVNIADDNIDVYAYDGTFVETLVDSDGVSGINFPEQVQPRINGNLLAGGFTSPSGVYEYDSSGAQLNYWDVGSSVRGVAELTNGNILWTSSGGIFTLDPSTGISTLVLAGSSRFVTVAGDATLGTSYCVAAGNSVAAMGSQISAQGSNSLAVASVHLNASNAPTQPAIFYFGPDQILAPFGNGFRCVGGTVTRMPVIAGAGGSFDYSVDFGTYGAILGGLGTVRFQCWYRDPAGGGAAFNLSDGLEITFVP